jgi:hypothetical protein
LKANIEKIDPKFPAVAPWGFSAVQRSPKELQEYLIENYRPIIGALFGSYLKRPRPELSAPYDLRNDK